MDEDNGNEDNSFYANNNGSLHVPHTHSTKSKKKKKHKSKNSKIRLGTAHGPDNLKRIDYVLVYDSSSDDRDVSASKRLHIDKMEDFRTKFELCLFEDDLILQKDVIGSKTYVKIHCNFDRLCKHAEAIKLEMPLKGLKAGDAGTSNKGLISRFISKYLKTDSEEDFISAPFERSKIHLYEGFEDSNTFFRPATRSFLTHNILINMDIRDTNNIDEDDLMSKKGLPYLLMKGAYKDAFTLHDESADDIDLKTDPTKDSDTESPGLDPRRDLNNTWTKIHKYQPLWKVRNYFGEKIAFYFAWSGMLITSLWIPTLFGLAIFFYGLYLSITNYNTNTAIQLTNTTNMTTTASLTSEITSKFNAWMEVIKEAFDNEITPFFALVMCLWGTIFLEGWKRTNSTLAYEWDVDQYETTEPDRPEFFGTRKRPDPVTLEESWYYPFYRQFMKYSASTSVLIIMVCTVFVSVMGVTVYRVILTVDYCPSMSGLQCAIVTTVASSVLNAVSILILGKVYDKIAYVLTDWENHRTQTGYNDALIIKLFAFQFANSYASLFYIAFIRGDVGSEGILGLGPKYKDDCGKDNNCMSLLSFQVLTLMILKPFPKLFKDIMLPWMKKRWQKRTCCRRTKVDIDKPRISKNRSHVNEYLIKEHNKPDLGDFTLGEFTEKVIQYGYLMMFAASLSLAPLIALLTNLIDKSTDAKRLLWWYRRPVAFIAQDIGMWYGILEFVNICGVISNGFIIAFTSSWSRNFDPYERLWLVIIFEHIVFGVKYLMAWLIPDVPHRVHLAMRREKYQVAKILETGMFISDMKVKELAQKQIEISRSNMELDKQDIDLSNSGTSLRKRTRSLPDDPVSQLYSQPITPTYDNDDKSYLVAENGKKRRRRKKKQSSGEECGGDSDVSPRTAHHNKLAPLRESQQDRMEMMSHDTIERDSISYGADGQIYMDYGENSSEQPISPSKYKAELRHAPIVEEVKVVTPEHVSRYHSMPYS